MIPIPPPKPIIYQADIELMSEVEYLKSKLKKLKKKLKKIKKLSK